jgi:hypothetical protein
MSDITFFQGGVEGLQGAGLQWVRFIKDIPSRNIEAGRISKAHIQKMRFKKSGIQVYPVYGEPGYFFSVTGEQELREILEPLTELEAIAATTREK